MMPQRAKEKIRTLLVEDKWLLRHATSRLLTREPDIEVVGTAPDGAAALEKIPILHPDLVVTDIAMPNMGGLELAFLLRRRFPDLGIVLVGIIDEPEIHNLCGLCGADALVNKAFLPGKLPAALRIVFATRKLATPQSSAASTATGSGDLRAKAVSGPAS